MEQAHRESEGDLDRAHSMAVELQTLLESDTSAGPDRSPQRFRRALARHALLLARQWRDVNPAQQEWARARLFEAAISPDPEEPTPLPDVDFISSSERAVASEGLAWVAAFEGWSGGKETAFEALAAGRCPEVRIELARNLGRLREQAGTRSASSRPGVDSTRTRSLEDRPASRRRNAKARRELRLPGFELVGPRWEGEPCAPRAVVGIRNPESSIDCGAAKIGE